MLAFPPRQRHWPVLGAFAQWWQHWIGTRATELLEVARLGAGEVEYLTHDANPPGSDLPTLVGHHTEETDLLRRRMVGLDLDLYELALSDPALVRHLQRCCTLCESRGRCELDLARASTDSAWQGRQDWREYCPNASTLEMLSALQSSSKAVPRYQFPYLA